MSVDQEEVSDIVAASRRVISFVQSSPPHVRPWLRGVAAEAEHIRLDVEAANRRASGRFATWLFAGLDDAGEETNRE